MASPRVQKMFQNITAQVRKLDGIDIDFLEAIRYSSITVPAGGTPLVSSGSDAMLLDMDSATWASGNRRAIVVAIPASDTNNTAALKTQSHSSGKFIDGSVRFEVYMEAPDMTNLADATDGPHFDFFQSLQQHMVGQKGAPTQFYFTAHAAEPTLDGVNASTTDATYSTSGKIVLPYGMVYPGGV